MKEPSLTFKEGNSGAWIFPKFINGKPLDHALSPTRFLVTFLPRMIVDRFGAPFLMKRAIEQHQGSMESWGLNPDCKPNQMHPTISHELLHRVGTGTIRIKKQIREFGEDFVVFSDGQKVLTSSTTSATISTTNIRHLFLQ